jgi:hypothetical protein
MVHDMNLDGTWAIRIVDIQTNSCCIILITTVYLYKRKMLGLSYRSIIVIVSLSIFAMVFLVFLQVNTVHGATASLSSSQSIGSATVQKVVQLGAPVFLAPISTSGNNVYVTWSSNKTGGNFEIMFRASSDGGKTFGPKINLSNSTKFDSVDPSIGSEGSNVYVSWWEVSGKDKINEPVFRASNDNGMTFGEKIMLSNASTTTAATTTGLPDSKGAFLFAR